jgi:glycosyltransferase involved in cell wall biosynthesis
MDTSNRGGVSVELLDLLDGEAAEAWVPSAYVREKYLSSGADAEGVVVIPPGVNHVLFTPGALPTPLPTTKTFKFLFTGGSRFLSGADIAIETYLTTFGPDDDVCLVIRDHPDDRAETLVDQLRQLHAMGGHAEILYLETDCPHDLMPGLYTACDALVHPYRADDFGLFVVEAMACGLPVIVPSHGTYLDFCDPTTAYMLPGMEVVSRSARWATRCSRGHSSGWRPTAGRLRTR